MEHHEYPPQVRDSLGEAVAAAALLSSTLKYDGLLSLQLRGEGPMHLMLVECTDGLAMRAVARFRDPPDTRDLRVLSGDGTLTVTVESGNGRQPLPGHRAARRRVDERLPARVLRAVRAAADAPVAARGRRRARAACCCSACPSRQARRA